MGPLWDSADRSDLVMVVRREALEKEWLKFGFWGFLDERLQMGVSYHSMIV